MGDYDFDIVIVGGGPAGAGAARAAVDGGLKALLIEKKKMPRHKPCSGMILPAALDFIEKYFGPLPDDVLAEPKTWKGSCCHLRGGQVFEMTVAFRNAWRDKLDNWLCSASGAEVWDSARLIDFAEWKDRVELVCRRGEEEIRLSTPVMVAADGGVSGIVKKIDPTFGLPPMPMRSTVRASYSFQDYRRGSVELDPSYYHTFFEPGIGLMPTLYFKDDLIVTDTIVHPGEKVNPMREKYTKWLADNHGFKPGEPVMTLACLAGGPMWVNRFCFGTDRVLVAGEAAGFLNMFFEGISSAIATGYLAGRAAVTSAGYPPGPTYRESVKPERERTARMWHTPSLMSGKAAPEFKESLMAASPMLRLRVMRETTGWLKRFGYEYNFGIEVTLRKILAGDFNFRA
jgi:flavin-dependent dehydrogenase